MDKESSGGPESLDFKIALAVAVCLITSRFVPISCFFVLLVVEFLKSKIAAFCYTNPCKNFKNVLSFERQRAV
jgi:hypothetical protein